MAQGDEGEHASGPPLFRAVRIVAIQITGSANAAVVYDRDAKLPALPRDLAGKVRFIVRRTDARTELHNKVRSG